MFYFTALVFIIFLLVGLCLGIVLRRFNKKHVLIHNLN